VADTHSRGIATAALSSIGHAIAVFFGTVVVVVLVVVVLVVVVVDVVVEFVVVVTGMVVVGTTVVVDGTVVVVVVTGMVVVVGEVLVEQVVGTVVVVVVASAGSLWADVVEAVVETTSVLSTTERSTQRRNQWCVRGAIQRIYRASRRPSRTSSRG
jgi:hypothetical protein